MSDTLAGTRHLSRLAIRRDRVILPIVIYVTGGASIATARAFDSTYSTAADRHRLYEDVAGNPALRAVTGPIFGDSLGALTAWRMTALGSLLLGLANLLLVIRHTRSEEESGRLELLTGTPLGRHAPLTAALAVTFQMNLAVASLVAAGLPVFGTPIVSGIALGLAFAGAGCVFAAVGAVAAQLVAYSRAAIGLAAGVLGASYFATSVAGASGGLDDPGARWLTWTNPIGWAVQVRAFAGDRWWVLALPVLATAVLLACAYRWNASRDFGAGVIPVRPGRVRAQAGLGSPLGLAWRLHRYVLLAWAVAFALAGMAFGSLANGVGDVIEGSGRLSDLIQRMGGQDSIANSYLSTTLGLLGLLAAVYAVQAVLRMRAEETSGHLEMVLATRVRRIQWCLSHLAFAVLGPVAMLAVAGCAAGLAYGVSTDAVGTEVPRLVGAALVQLPAVWLLAAVGLALFGLLPRAAAASWVVVGVVVFITELGPMLEFNHWIMDLSPFSHLPRLPGQDLVLLPLIWLLALTALVKALGLAAFRRRDVGLG